MAFRTRETVVTERNNSGTILAVVVIIALAAIAYLIFFQESATGTTVEVDLPNVIVDTVPAAP